MQKLFLLIFALASLVAAPGFADRYLLMAEVNGCYWCARWKSEIGPIYPKTDEGKIAPLHTYNMFKDKPDVEFAEKVVYSPTFILIENNREVGRIEGYTNDEFFWGLLGQLLAEADQGLVN